MSEKPKQDVKVRMFKIKRVSELRKIIKNNLDFFSKEDVKKRKKELSTLILNSDWFRNWTPSPDDIEDFEDDEREKAETRAELAKLRKNQKRPRKAFNPIAIFSGGQKPYTEEEQQEFLKKEADKNLLDITQPLGSFFNPKTNQEKTLKLQPHQKEFLLKFVNGDMRGSILFHGTGTGKTITAVSVSSAFLRLNPNSKVFVITPSATLINFIFGMIQWGLDVRDNRYRFFTYERYSRAKEDCSNALMIIDEAHNFRTYMGIKITTEETVQGDTVEVESSSANKRGFNILKHCAMKASKILLLTATPFVNYLYDIENLLAMINNRNPIDQNEYYTITSSIKDVKDYFKCAISRFSLPVSSDFPDKNNHLVPIVMGEKFLAEYMIIENSRDKGVKAFFNGVRRLTNSFNDINNKKVKWIIDKIQKGSKDDKHVVYSGFLDNGIRMLMQVLNDLNIKFATITGKENATKKEISKNRFNHFIPDDEGYRKAIKRMGLLDSPNYNVNVLLITKASAEGVDLIGTTNMILMDGWWNEALIQQIIARAVRFQSHTHLPKNKQYVDIFRMVMIKPTDIDTIKKVREEDKPQWGQLFNSMVETNERIKEINKIESKKNKITFKSINLQDNTIDRKLKKDMKMTVDEVKALSRKERREAWKKVEHDKLDYEKQMAEAQGLIRSSIDYYMLVRSKSKQMTIESFIKKLELVQKTEKCITNKEIQLIDTISKFQKKNKRLITEKEKDEVRRKIFSSAMTEFKRGLDEEINEISEERKEILKMREEKRQKKLDKAIIERLQQFFTPEPIVKELHRRVGIDEDIRPNLQVLEPTAGDGAMIAPLIDDMIKGEQYYKIDLVEFSTEERNNLREDIEKSQVQDYVNLMQQGNFLKFIPSNRYDYILMNPPFHLKRSLLPTILKRDAWDIDFVKRAFGMLKKGGKLIVLLGRKYVDNKEGIFGEFNKWLGTINSSQSPIKARWAESKSKNKVKQQLMAQLGMSDFMVIILVKEEKDLKNDRKLLTIDYENLLMGKPNIIDEQLPAIYMEDNSVSDKINVSNPIGNKAQIKKELKTQIKKEQVAKKKAEKIKLKPSIKKIIKKETEKIKKGDIDLFSDLDNVVEESNNRKRDDIIDVLIQGSTPKDLSKFLLKNGFKDGGQDKSQQKNILKFADIDKVLNLKIPKGIQREFDEKQLKDITGKSSIVITEIEEEKDNLDSLNIFALRLMAKDLQIPRFNKMSKTQLKEKIRLSKKTGIQDIKDELFKKLIKEADESPDLTKRQTNKLFKDTVPLVKELMKKWNTAKIKTINEKNATKLSNEYQNDKFEIELNFMNINKNIINKKQLYNKTKKDFDNNKESVNGKVETVKLKEGVKILGNIGRKKKEKSVELSVKNKKLNNKLDNKIADLKSDDFLNDINDFLSKSITHNTFRRNFEKMKDEVDNDIDNIVRSATELNIEEKLNKSTTKKIEKLEKIADDLFRKIRKKQLARLQKIHAPVIF